MHLHNKGHRFLQMASHLQCTQCLGSLAGKPWRLQLHLHSLLLKISAFRSSRRLLYQIRAGNLARWTYFDSKFMDFYNL